MLFLDPATRALFDDWSGKARDTVADVRLSAGRHPGDPHLAALIDELVENSSDFAALWSAHPVRVCDHHTRRYHHPQVGELTLSDQLLLIPDGGGQRLVIYHAEPRSSSAARLSALRGR